MIHGKLATKGPKRNGAVSSRGYTWLPLKTPSLHLCCLLVKEVDVLVRSSSIYDPENSQTPP